MELLFSYGTLRLESVQRASFGRLLDGTADRLPGFRLDTVEITDPDVLEKSGEKIHPIVRRTGRPEDTVEGIAFEVTAEELAEADAYEVDDYERVRVTLVSGREAWVYVARSE